MGDLFTQVFNPAPFYPQPHLFYDTAPAPSAPPEAPAAPPEAPAAPPEAPAAPLDPPDPKKRGRAAAPREATHGWCYGAFKDYSKIGPDGTLIQGWLKVPIGVGDDGDENDEAMAPVEEWDFGEFDSYVGTFNPQADVPAAQQPVPDAIDVGDYYMANDDRVLQAIGTLMATEDL